MARGSTLEKGVLAWCFQNALVLQGLQPDWTVVSYEQLVLDPEPVVAHLVERLELTDKALILSHLTEAAGNKAESRTTRPGNCWPTRTPARLVRKQALVEKWRAMVTPEQEVAAMSLLATFDLDAYSAGRPAARSALLDWWRPARARLSNNAIKPANSGQVPFRCARTQRVKAASASRPR